VSGWTIARGIRAIGLIALLGVMIAPVSAQTPFDRSQPPGGATSSPIGGSLSSPESQLQNPTRPGGGDGGPGLTEEIAAGLRPRTGRFALSGPIDPEVYLVGPGDLLQLILWGKLSKTLELDVSPDGNILLPGFGALPVSGHTLSRVEVDVVKVMRDQYRGVNIQLRLLQPRTFRIYLTGRVVAPGPLEVSGGFRISDVLTPAMFLPEASRRHIEMIHRDGTREIADLERFLRVGDSSADPALRDGDVVNIPVATDFVHAAGAVASPGRIELGTGDSLRTLIRLAGDPLPSADAERALLVRFARPFQPESLWFGLDDAYSGRVNPPLRDGDRLYIYYVPRYHLQHEASVVGEVARPGVYPIVEGRHHLSDLLAAAGGFLPAADLSAIRVNRRNPETSEHDPELDRLLRLSRNELTNTEFEVMRTKLSSLKEDFRVDWNRLAADKTDLDLALRDGDLVRVERLVASIRIDGEVRRPGILVYKPGLGIEDYVEQAGGFTDRAWHKRVRITHAVTGQTTLAKGGAALDPGDIIYVPEKRDGNLGQSTQTFLLFAAQIATIALAVISIRNN
jgi:protein involved in polysaccharide export with SLBB domain